MDNLCPNLTENENQLLAALRLKAPYPEKFQAVMVAFEACLTEIKEMRLRRLADWHAKRSGEFRPGHWEDVRQEMLLKAIEHLTKQMKGEATYVFDGRTTFLRYLAGCYDPRNTWRKRQKEKDLFVEWPFHVDNGEDTPDVEDNSQPSATEMWTANALQQSFIDSLLAIAFFLASSRACKMRRRRPSSSAITPEHADFRTRSF